jgi:hypothetical protein
VKGKPDIIDIIAKKILQFYGRVKRVPEERIPRLLMECIPLKRRKRGRPRKIRMEGVSTSNHDNNKFRTSSVEKQR